jgi:hypothetical protein
MNSSSQEDITPEKKALFEALQKNELPNNVDRAIIRDTTSGHFTCVRKLTNGQWICMDSNLSEPFPIPDNDLAKFIGNRGSYQIFYCKSSEDQKRFEDIISAK